MKKVGGNTVAIVQKRKVTKHSIGSGDEAWENVCSLTGWLDISSGDSRRSEYNAKIQESTHVFVCDYQKIDVKAEPCRILIDGEVYDVKYIDDPMRLHYQLEIFLNYLGGES